MPFCSVYSGHQSILIPPVELESNPALWLLAVSQLRVRDTFCSYSVMELCTKGLGLQTEALKVRPAAAALFCSLTAFPECTSRPAAVLRFRGNETGAPLPLQTDGSERVFCSFHGDGPG